MVTRGGVMHLGIELARVDNPLLLKMGCSSVRSFVCPLKSTSPNGVRRVASLRTHRVLMRVYVFFELFLRLNRRFKRGFARDFHTRFIKFVTFTDRDTYFESRQRDSGILFCKKRQFSHLKVPDTYDFLRPRK